MKKSIPFGISTLSEREEFYDKEFSIKKVRKWFRGRKFPQLCAIDAGSETGIIINKKLKGQMLYFPFKELEKKIKQYVPEDVYYDRNVYDDPEKVLKTVNFKNHKAQELAFDIDSDNIPCNHSRNTDVCNICLGKAFNAAKKMKKILLKDFKKIEIVYSGRGFHVHVFDKKAYFLTIKEREVLNKKFKSFPIDPWVSRGHIKLIRMPYTLNSLVSRIVMPLPKNDSFKQTVTIPKFMKN